MVTYIGHYSDAHSYPVNRFAASLPYRALLRGVKGTPHREVWPLHWLHYKVDGISSVPTYQVERSRCVVAGVGRGAILLRDHAIMRQS